MATKTVTIIGAGKAGSTLGKVLHRSGILKVIGVLDSFKDKSWSAANFIALKGETITTDTFLCSDVVMITTPDDQIEKCAQSLAEKKLVGPGTIVFHCSGYHSSSVLSSLKARGCLVASVHPVKSFADPAVASSTFSKTPCGGEGDSGALDLLKQAFEGAGGIFFEIDTESKKMYHAAAVLLCGGVVALLKAGSDLLCSSGLSSDQAKMLLNALTPETLNNALNHGFSAALTGPVARGDSATIRGELSELKKKSALYYDIYKALSGVSLEMVAKEAQIDPTAINEMRHLIFNDNE
ncbi:DUF2520 domain-containing protein [Chitinispirillales bacterium ANBcel5]|uniref:Rossmann-like and DUF2520 domain-containing protein n=1 Tax=Cellulosispirillum alkaliphilum TaxID=3039283 RepID=UPI002A4EB0B1|nr:DUF2520 domain-containing protein [Chitinispirillales bacterium ANBcel5]